MPLIGPRHGACYSALRRVNISKLHQKLRTSINLMVTSSCTVRTFLGWRLINIWAFILTAAYPGKTTLIMCTLTVPGRLAFCAAYNVNSGQELFGRSSSEQSDHGLNMPAPCGVGEIPASWSNCKNCSAAGTRLSYLNCNSDLTITHWCCSSRSNRTWPLLIWQSFCHNSLPTVVIIFEKICIPFLL